MAALAVGLTAGGCADDTFDPVHGYDTDREVSLNLRLPAFAAASTRAVDENALQDIKIYFMKDQAVGAEETLSPEAGNLKLGEGANKNTATATVLVPAGTTSIRLVGNYTAAGLADESNPNVMTFDPNSKNSLVFYGESSVQNLESGNGNIDLYRSCAKTTFALDEELTDDFEVLSYEFYGKPESGMVAYTSTTATTPNLPTDIEYAKNPVTVSATPYYHYEAAAGKCCWIIKGKYNGQVGYYKVAYIKDDDEEHTATDNAEELALLRNHHYQFVIKGVNAPGYATAAAALEAPAENRLRVVLNDHAENIFDIIACADYYLGVKDEVTATAENIYYEFDIISSYKKGAPTATLVEEADWISNINVAESKNSTTAPTDGKLYTVSCTLTENTASSDSRTAKILIRVGDLSREVLLTQEGADFMYGALAPQVAILNSGVTSPKFKTGTLNGEVNYFGFLKESLNGETEEEMGVSRGDGLHFQVYAESGKQFTYKIAKLPTSQSPTLVATDPELVKVTDEGKYWSVELTDAGNRNYDIWKSSVVMQDKTVTITYQVYHTGIIHYLDGTGQTAGPSGETVKGWFYYEQADVTGEDGQTYHILDRNIGASSNVAYSPGSTFLSNATEARGAYLIVPGKEKMAELEAKLPAGFNTLPGMYHLANMGFKLFNASEGSMGWDSQSNSLLPRIYLPVAGSMDGTSHVDQFRAEIWSNTMVQGNQGFFPGDAEYGYWYRILNVYGAEINITTQRIASRSTRASRGIPVRAMACPPAEPGWELPTIAEGRSRIILMNDAGWTSATIKCGGENIDGKYNSAMVAGDNDKTWFYADIKGKPTTVEFSSGSSKTETFTVSLVNGQATFSNAGVEGAKPITIYMRDDKSWGSAYIHYWNSSYKFTDWNNLPEMTLDSSVGGSNEKWYKYVIDGTTETLCFTKSSPGDGGNQAGDYEDIQSKLDETRILRFSNSSGYIGTGEPTEGGGETPTDPITIYMRDDANWENVYIHYWNDQKSFTEWGNLPQMTLDTSVGNSGEKWYKYVIDGATEKLLFNSGTGNNSTKTKDLDDIQSKLDATRILRFSNEKINDSEYGKFLGKGAPSGSGSGEGGGGSGEGGGGGDDSTLPAIPSGKARVVVYNDEGWWTGGKMEFEYQYSGGQTKVDMNQVTVDGKTLFYIDINPGMTQFHINREQPSWQWSDNGSWFNTSNITAGNTYYFTVSSSGKLSTSTKKHAPRRAVRRK